MGKKVKYVMHLNAEQSAAKMKADAEAQLRKKQRNKTIINWAICIFFVVGAFTSASESFLAFPPLLAAGILTCPLVKLDKKVKIIGAVLLLIVGIALSKPGKEKQNVPEESTATSSVTENAEG